jgi:hypothetical protein
VRPRAALGGRRDAWGGPFVLASRFEAGMEARNAAPGGI